MKFAVLITILPVIGLATSVPRAIQDEAVTELQSIADAKELATGRNDAREILDLTDEEMEEWVFGGLIHTLHPSKRDLAADLKPIMRCVKPCCVAIKKGCKAAATNVKGLGHKLGPAGQLVDGCTTMVGDLVTGAGETAADVPKAAYQLIKELEKKGPVSTVLKILFGPPPKHYKGKGNHSKGKHDDEDDEDDEDN